MEEEKWIKHYSSSHQILLVGEGDFSFAACLAKAFGSAKNMVATSLDSKETLMVKHSTAKANLEYLNEFGCTILHEVDATTMYLDASLGTRRFDRIVFNFPHSGFRGCGEHRLVQYHQDLVKNFFRSARNMLTWRGEIHVTHKTANPFNEWKLEELAKMIDLDLLEEVEFNIWDYPGYKNKRGDGLRSNESFPVGTCSTFKFVRQGYKKFTIPFTPLQGYEEVTFSFARI